MAPYLTLETTLTTDQGSWPHTQTWVPPGWAWSGPCPRPSQKLHTTLGQSRQPRVAKLFPQDQASSPGRFTTLCLEKKGTAGIDKFKVCPPGPPAALQPNFLITFRASTAQFHLVSSKGSETLSLLHLLLSLPFSFHTNQGTGAHSAQAGATQSQKSSSPSPTGSSHSLARSVAVLSPRLLRALSTQLSPG